MTNMLRPLLLSLALGTSSIQAAPLPLPVQAVLQQIKGEWLILDDNLLTTRLSLQADGQGQVSLRDGSSPITWRLDGGKIKVSLLERIPRLGVVYEDDREYAIEDSVAELTLEFKTFEGFTAVWSLSTLSNISYPENPEKPARTETVTSPKINLIAGRQLKNFTAKQGEILSLTLPNYIQQGKDYEETTPVIVRLDAANVVTVLQGPDLGQDTLFWTIDQGRLRVSNGKGYTVSYREYKGDATYGRLLADVQISGRLLISDDDSVRVNTALQAQGFQPTSPLFQGCWKSFSTKYCFTADRVFTFTFKSPDGVETDNTGLWRIENGKILIDRYRDSNGLPILDRAGMLQCEQELADASIPEKSCRIFQSRSYELLNQSANSIATYRILKLRSGDVYNNQVFTRQ